jgi:hypothetical protein
MADVFCFIDGRFPVRGSAGHLTITLSVSSPPILNREVKPCRGNRRAATARRIRAGSSIQHAREKSFSKQINVVVRIRFSTSNVLA